MRIIKSVTAVLIFYRIGSKVVWFESDSEYLHSMTHFYYNVTASLLTSLFLSHIIVQVAIYRIGFGLVEIAISTNPKPTIYHNLI